MGQFRRGIIYGFIAGALVTSLLLAAFIKYSPSASTFKESYFQTSPIASPSPFLGGGSCRLGDNKAWEVKLREELSKSLNSELEANFGESFLVAKQLMSLDGDELRKNLLTTLKQEAINQVQFNDTAVELLSYYNQIFVYKGMIEEWSKRASNIDKLGQKYAENVARQFIDQQLERSFYHQLQTVKSYSQVFDYDNLRFKVVIDLSQFSDTLKGYLVCRQANITAKPTLEFKVTWNAFRVDNLNLTAKLNKEGQFSAGVTFYKALDIK